MPIPKDRVVVGTTYLKKGSPYVSMMSKEKIFEVPLCIAKEKYKRELVEYVLGNDLQEEDLWAWAKQYISMKPKMVPRKVRCHKSSMKKTRKVIHIPVYNHTKVPLHMRDPRKENPVESGSHYHNDGFIQPCQRPQLSPSHRLGIEPSIM